MFLGESYRVLTLMVSPTRYGLIIVCTVSHFSVFFYPTTTLSPTLNRQKYILQCDVFSLANSVRRIVFRFLLCIEIFKWLNYKPSITI